MKIKNTLTIAATCAFLSWAAGCGKKDAPPSTEGDAAPITPATAEQQLATPEVFNRTIARVRGLIQVKDYTQARQTLQLLDNNKLTPEQQRVFDQVKAQIPAN